MDFPRYAAALLTGTGLSAAQAADLAADPHAPIPEHTTQPVVAALRAGWAAVTTVHHDGGGVR